MEPDTSISSVRVTKRKLEDAIRALDGAIATPPLATASAIERPTPSKRLHFTRSVYSTLSKVGATSKERSRPSSKSTTDVTKRMPHLAAILARSTSQSKQAPAIDHLPPSPAHPACEYRPSSTDSFLSRLATYKITTYANKPPQIDAVAAARCGWTNEGKDRLVCGMCDASWVLAGREGMSKDAAGALLEKQRLSLVEMHKDGCPWKARQCEPSIYRVPLQSPAAMVRELRATALSLESTVANVTIKHPLSPPQLSSLHSIFVAASQERVSKRNSAMSIDENTHTILASDTSIVIALFGWGPAPTTTRSDLRRTSSLSISRAGSYGPSVSVPPTPSISRASSVSSHFRQRAITPTPSASRASTSQLNTSPDCLGSTLRTKNPSNYTTAITGPRDASFVYCVLCQRRVGLWGYSRNETMALPAHDESLVSTVHARQKGFDLVREHRSYCPYVVCSSVVPSLSDIPMVDSLRHPTEGWRAVFTVVQRYELSQRQRLSRFLPSDDLHSQAPSEELRGVEAMVAGVKTNGGRELLKYVKGLLG